MDPTTDERCVARCRAGDAEAYRLLVARYERVVLAYARGRLGQAEGAEEVAQEAFVRAYVRLAELRQPAAFGPWLIGIAGRVLQERWRRAQREVRAMNEWRRLARPEPDAPAVADLELDRCIAELAEPYRDVVLLRFYGGLSCAEVGQRLGLPVGSVTKVLSRAYRMLREKLPSEESAKKGCRDGL